MNNKKIVVTSDDKFVTARLFEDDENLIKMVKIVSIGGDFEHLAAIAVSKLVDSFDWNSFEAGKISVKVTENNFNDFVSAAKSRGFTFKPDEDFNPFTDVHVKAITAIFVLLSNETINDNEIHITYEDGCLKIHHLPYDKKVVVW